MLFSKLQPWRKPPCLCLALSLGPVRIIALCPVFSVGRTLRMSTRHSDINLRDSHTLHKTFRVLRGVLRGSRASERCSKRFHKLHKIVPVERGLQFFPQSFHVLETLHCRSNPFGFAFGCLSQREPPLAPTGIKALQQRQEIYPQNKLQQRKSAAPAPALD